MTSARHTKPRAPQVFSIAEATVEEKPSIPFEEEEEGREEHILPSVADLTSRIRWGALLLSALASLSGLAVSLAYLRFISIALERQDWVGWIAFCLLCIAGLSIVVLLLREVLGLFRLQRLHRLHRSVAHAVTNKDEKAEKEALKALQELLGDRADCRWGLARLAEHAADVRDPGDLLRLADREILKPLDDQIKKSILKSSKRVATVTAISPLMLFAMLYVLIENLRMLRTLASLYGGRPGWAGSIKLGGMVVSHIIATGGVALTEDLVGQFLGQDLLRRMSRRLGEGAFNGAMTARIGVAAIAVIRPLPFMEAPKIRIRDLLREIFKSDDLQKKKTKVS